MSKGPERLADAMGKKARFSHKIGAHVVKGKISNTTLVIYNDGSGELNMKGLKLSQYDFQPYINHDGIDNFVETLEHNIEAAQKLIAESKAVLKVLKPAVKAGFSQDLL